MSKLCKKARPNFGRAFLHKQEVLRNDNRNEGKFFTDESLQIPNGDDHGMRMWIWILLAYIVIYIFSLYFEWVKFAASIVLCLAKVVISFFVRDFMSPVLLCYGLMTGAFFLLQIGNRCFSVDNDTDGWIDKSERPFTTAAIILLVSTLVIGFFCSLATTSDCPILLTIASIIEIAVIVYRAFWL